jgi:hypothetical protein
MPYDKNAPEPKWREQNEPYAGINHGPAIPNYMLIAKCPDGYTYYPGEGSDRAWTPGISGIGDTAPGVCKPDKSIKGSE